MSSSKHNPGRKHPDSQPPQSASRRNVLRVAGASALASMAPLLATPARAQEPSSASASRIRRRRRTAGTCGPSSSRRSIEDKTGGKITVQIFPNAQMGNERDTAQAVRQGSLEMGAIGVGLMNWVPEMSITDAPFLWKSRAHSAANAIDGAFGDDLRKRSLDKGFVLTGWTDLGFRCMTNNKHADQLREGHAEPEDARAELQGLHRDDAGDRRHRPSRST